MRPLRVHITGASGSGTTTLGAALAEALSLTHLDADDYYWLPTQPPYQTKRAMAGRHDLLAADLATAPRVVLSGSVMGWGTAIEDAFDLVVFLYLPASVRLPRLRERELAKLGHVDEAFITWAAEYDDGPSEGRSLRRHLDWLAARRCPVLRLDADESVPARVGHVIAALAGHTRAV